MDRATDERRGDPEAVEQHPPEGDLILLTHNAAVRREVAASR
jgi:hypothetical protein